MKRDPSAPPNLPNLTRRRWLAAVGGAAVSAWVGCSQAPGVDKPQPTASADPLDAALHWLVRRQQSDGGWRSEHYAQLRGGVALTALVRAAVEGCLQTPAGLVRCPGLHLRPLQLLRERVAPDGSLGADDPELLEYPNYSTALALHSLAAAKLPGDEPLVERMTRYLVGQQYCEATGFGPEHVCYGGWGFGGPRPVGGSPGHMDLGHTRHVLEALRATGHDNPATYRRAERFLRLLQKHPDDEREQSTPDRAPTTNVPAAKAPYDGGFYFSPVVLDANKGGTVEHAGRPYFASYATTTCDGILALLACGAPRDDERVRAAAAWLNRHPRLDYPEGVPDDTDENWGASIRFYHYAVRAECYAALNRPGPWRDELRRQLVKRQQPDGSFVNREGFLMKEDDPLLCTALAVVALSRAEQPATSAA